MTKDAAKIAGTRIGGESKRNAIQLTKITFSNLITRTYLQNIRKSAEEQ